MRELRDLSKLPTDQAYWVELEARIGQAARRQAGRWADGQMGSRPGWWVPLASRAVALGGLAIAAGIAALLLVPPRTQEGVVKPAMLLRLPDDPGMVEFLSSPEPPSLGSLMASLLRSTP